VIKSEDRIFNLHSLISYMMADIASQDVNEWERINMINGQLNLIDFLMPLVGEEARLRVEKILEES